MTFGTAEEEKREAGLLKGWGKRECDFCTGIGATTAAQLGTLGTDVAVVGIDA